MNTEEKALKLLATGLQPVVVAAAVGVTKGRISQLMEDPTFMVQLAEQQALLGSGAVERDQAYDDLETLLLDKLRTNVPMMFKTQEILGAIRIINSAKRRSIVNPDLNNTAPKIVKLCLPSHVTAKFTINAQGVVVEVAGRELTTIDSGSLLKEVQQVKKPSHADITDATIIQEGKPHESSSHVKAAGSTQLPAATGILNI